MTAPPRTLSNSESKALTPNACRSAAKKRDATEVKAIMTKLQADSRKAEQAARAARVRVSGLLLPLEPSAIVEP